MLQEMSLVGAHLPHDGRLMTRMRVARCRQIMAAGEDWRARTGDEVRGSRSRGCAA